MAEKLVSVTLSAERQQFVRRCFNEIGGGSSKAFYAIANHDGAIIADSLAQYVAATEEFNPVVTLPEPTWRVVYDIVHATMYALGPFELPIILGVDLVEAAEVNLRICVAAWGAYGGMAWDGTDLRERR